MEKVIIYTKKQCSYCEKAKNYFNSKHIPFDEKDVTNDQKLLEEMLSKSNGRKTVPEIFIGNQHVGGWDDLNKLIQEGKIDGLFNKG